MYHAAHAKGDPAFLSCFGTDHISCKRAERFRYATAIAVGWDRCAASWTGRLLRESAENRSDCCAEGGRTGTDRKRYQAGAALRSDGADSCRQSALGRQGG